jgi:DNA-binding MarR family transcriptional regulator
MPTTTGIVNRLVRDGYVRRASALEDRRQVMVELTPKGRAFISDFQGVVRRRWLDVLRALGPGELGAFYRVITKLHGQLRIAG